MPLRATCVACVDHDAPAPACACGIYAARTAPLALRYLVGRDDPDVVQRVFGLVALWGRAFEGPDGWRGELAYASRLWVPASPRAHELAALLDEYGVRVEVLDDARVLAA